MVSRLQNTFSPSGKTYLLMVAKGVLLSVPPDGVQSVSADRETDRGDNLLRLAITLCPTFIFNFQLSVVQHLFLSEYNILLDISNCDKY